MDFIKETERWLYNYNTIKAGIENLKMLYETKSTEIGSGLDTTKEHISPTYAFSSETENIAIDIIVMQQRIEHMETKIKVIDTALLGLNNTERTIVEMKYFEGCRWYQIAYKVGYEERQCRRIKNIVLEKLKISIFGIDNNDDVKMSE